MSNISEIDKSLIPQSAVLCKKGMRTKKIYLNEDDLTDVSVKEDIFAQNETESLNFKNTYMGPATSMNIYLKENGMSKESTIVAEKVNGNIHLKKSFVITIDKPMEILYDAPKYIYCIEELPPPEIIPIDKAPTTTSLNDITNYINKTTESIKSCKSYIAYVINNKGGSATDTETLESLINKLNDTLNFSPDAPPPPIAPIDKPFKLKLNEAFKKISHKLQEINDLLKVNSDNLKTIMDANNLMYESTDNFSTLVKKLNSEPSSLLINGKEFNSIVKQNQSYGDVKSIYFIKRDIMPTNGIDVSAKKDKSIMLYSEDKINDSSMPEPKVAMYTHIVIVSKNKIMFNKDCSNMFEGLYFDYFYFENIDTSNVENMSRMFKNSGLSRLKNEKIDTSSVLDTSNMFEGCNRLCGGITIKNPNLTKFDNMFLNAGGGIADIFVIDYVDEKTKQIATQMKNTGGTNIIIKGDDVPTSP